MSLGISDKASSLPYISSLPTLAPSSRQTHGTLSGPAKDETSPAGIDLPTRFANKRVTCAAIRRDMPLAQQRISFFILKQGLNVPTMNKLRSNFKRLNISVQQIPSRYLRCLIQKSQGKGRGYDGAKLGFHGDLLIFRLQESSPEFRKTLIQFLHKYMILPTSFLLDDLAETSAMIGQAPWQGANGTKEASSD